MLKDHKIEINAPCLMREWDRKKEQEKVIAPSVDCSYNCGRCPWNPEETQRRFEEGEWVETNGIRHLLFKRREVVV